MSIRWEGYLQPAFSEAFEFLLEINDGARLFLDGELLLDEFEAEVNDDDHHHSYAVSTRRALVADRLYAVKIEFRESTGAAAARLFWRSPHSRRRSSQRTASSTP